MPTQTSYDALDAEELFRLGLHASSAGDSASALNLLKLATQRDTGHAQAAWLLGAEYAQLGMMDRARTALEHAVQTAPALAGARFQLGLLHLTSGNPETARQVWARLDEESEGNPYRLFKSGMLLLAESAFDAALETLARCAASPAIDAALKRDVEMVMTQIRSRGPVSPSVETPKDAGDEAGSPLFLSAYRDAGTN